ncbi:hypothetical protein Pcinc_000530 [Petrolisthes cinctipes]|uniref:Uncharacterized protein n=1 Tax=Petrolisthes cinctipes TaxID=88211 RepID=A0AAE1L5A9_PETCI|nr:hypothetical protein Pcinc_000530 [Petrolisthes cinctipes]
MARRQQLHHRTHFGTLPRTTMHTSSPQPHTLPASPAPTHTTHPTTTSTPPPHILPTPSTHTMQPTTSLPTHPEQTQTHPNNPTDHNYASLSPILSKPNQTSTLPLPLPIPPKPSPTNQPSPTQSPITQTTLLTPIQPMPPPKPPSLVFPQTAPGDTDQAERAQPTTPTSTPPVTPPDLAHDPPDAALGPNASYEDKPSLIPDGFKSRSDRTVQRPR